MASAAVHKLLHPHRSRDHGSHEGSERQDSAAVERTRDEEKHALAQWGEHTRTLEPGQIAVDPDKKTVGHSSNVLRQEDFELVKTLGTGTFARVWLVRLRNARHGDENQVFALKVLRKTDGRYAPRSPPCIHRNGC